MKLRIFIMTTLIVLLPISRSSIASEGDIPSVEGYIQAACARYSKFVYFSAEQMKKNVSIASLLASIDSTVSDRTDASNLKYVATYTYKNVFIVRNDNVWNQMLFNASNDVYLMCYEGAHKKDNY